MAAKNVIGPVSIALAYALLKAGGGSGAFVEDLAAKLGLTSAAASSAAAAVAGSNGGAAAAAAAAAGNAAAALALACWCSTLLFPLVVRRAQRTGRKAGVFVRVETMCRRFKVPAPFCFSSISFAHFLRSLVPPCSALG
jgi:hypothetical protein